MERDNRYEQESGNTSVLNYSRFLDVHGDRVSVVG